MLFSGSSAGEASRTPVVAGKRICFFYVRSVDAPASDFFLGLFLELLLLLVLDFVGVLFLAFFFRFFSTLVAHDFAPVKSCFIDSA